MVKPRGFSLVELLAVFAIMGVLFAVALPAVTEWVASQKVRDTALSIHTTFVRARSEALSRGRSVSIVPVGGNWASGWDIPDPDPARNPDPANPTIYVERNAAVPNVTIAGTGTVTISSVGRIPAQIGLKVTATGTDTTRCVRLSTTGRPKTAVIASADACP